MTAAPIDEAPGVVATPARLEAWAAAARPGERFVYATRCALPPGSAGAGFARVLAARRLVDLARRRVSADGVFSYFAERTSRPWTDPAVARTTLAAPVAEVEPAIEREAVDALLPVLTRAARFHRPCPTNRQLAERVEVTPDRIEQLLFALRALGFVHIGPAPAPTHRFVTILANGWRTGLAA